MNTGHGDGPAISGALLLVAAIGCREESSIKCPPEDSQYERAVGSLEVAYDGSVGRAPRDGWHLLVRTTGAESVSFDGCAYHGSDLWFLELLLQVPVDVERPVPFGEPGATADAVVARCRSSECGGTLQRAWFGLPSGATERTGSVLEFDPIQGAVSWNLSMTETVAPSQAETISLSGALQWESQYQPILAGTLDGRWLVQSLDGSEFVARFEFTQEGVRLTARVCDEAFSCEDSDFTGVIADPYVRAGWTTIEEGTSVEYQLNATLEQAGERFTGTVSQPRSSNWQVVGQRVTTQ